MSSSRPEEPLSAEDRALPLHTMAHDASGHTHPTGTLPTVPESLNGEIPRCTSPPMSITSHAGDAARVPTITRHPSHMISLQGPHILGSIASGAHYAGALSPTKQTDEHFEGRLTLRHVRSMSRSGKEPVVEETYRDVMNDLEELFCGRVTHELLERRIAKDAEFEDTWCKCTGFDETASKFVAVSKLYSKCERQESRILSGSLNPNELVFSQKQMYTYRLIGMKRTVISYVHVWLDDEFKVVRIVDEWNGEELPTGRGMTLLRKFNGHMAKWLFHVPK